MAVFGIVGHAADDILARRLATDTVIDIDITDAVNGSFTSMTDCIPRGRPMGLNHLIDNGTYDRIPNRWGLTTEAIDISYSE